jgi:hypothetical protein
MGICFQLVKCFNRNFRTLSRGLVPGNIGRKPPELWSSGICSPFKLCQSHRELCCFAERAITISSIQPGISTIDPGRPITYVPLPLNAIVSRVSSVRCFHGPRKLPFLPLPRTPKTESARLSTLASDTFPPPCLSRP